MHSHCGPALKATLDAALEASRPVELSGTRVVWCVSDLHVDFKENMAWLQALCAQGGHEHDSVIVAGDVCTDLKRLEDSLALLVGSFQHVFYCVGNHELWQFGTGPGHSLDKFFAIMEVCRVLGVHTTACQLEGGLRIHPLQSWYKSTFWPRQHAGWTTHRGGDVRSFDAACKWPACVGDPLEPRNSLVGRALLLCQVSG